MGIKKSTSANMVDIDFVIVTKGRKHLVKRCLHSISSLAKTVANGATRVIIVNDSHDCIFCTDFLDTLDSSLPCLGKDGLRLMGIEPQRQEALLEAIVSHVPWATSAINSFCRPLGTEGWNLSSARNIIRLIYACCIDAPQCICFVDDDILMTPFEYNGFCYEPSATQTFEQAHDTLRDTSLFAIGAEFFGREDITITRHLEKEAERTLSTSTPMTNRGQFPYRIVSSIEECDPSPVPSGGFLLTSPGALRLAPLFHCYNEDWIWSRLVASCPGTVVRRAPSWVLHAPPESEFPDEGMACFQERGEVLFDVFDYLSSSEVTCGRVDANLSEDLVKRTIKNQSRLLESRQGKIERAAKHSEDSASRLWSEAAMLVNSSKCHLASTSPEEMCGEIRASVDGIYTWRQIVDKLRAERVSIDELLSSE